MDDARGLLEQALAVSATALGADSMNSAVQLNNLALVLADNGASDAAERNFRRSLALRLARLGEADLSVARARHNLGRLLLARGQRLAEALPLIERAASARQVLPENHPDRLDSLMLLAEARLAAGHLSEARTLADEAAARGGTLPGHRRVTLARLLALVARAAGDDAAALVRWQEAEAAARLALPAKHPQRLAAMIDLAEAHVRAGDTDAARRLLVSASPSLTGYAPAAPLSQRARRLLAQVSPPPMNKGGAVSG